MQLTAEQTETKPSYKGVLGIFRWIDDRMYSIEKIIVVTALVIMSLLIFLDMLYLNMIGDESKLATFILSFVDTSEETAKSLHQTIIPGLLLLALTGMAYVIASRAQIIKGRPWPFKVGLAILLMGLTIGFLHMLTASESKWVYLSLWLAGVVIMAVNFVGNRKAEAADRKRALTILIVAVVVTPFVIFWVVPRVPQGYTWAQKYSLFLLLWVGFIGASMAAKTKRHLRIDFARKLVPARIQPFHNALSNIIAATFTILVCYLGLIYIFDEDFGSYHWRTNPGDIPDWLKVFSTPMALAVMATRFFCQAVGDIITGVRPPPKAGDHTPEGLDDVEMQVGADEAMQVGADENDEDAGTEDGEEEQPEDAGTEDGAEDGDGEQPEDTSSADGEGTGSGDADKSEGGTK